MNADVLESLIQTHLPAAARGDRDAYGRIVTGCQSTVTSIALAITRDLPSSEDIAQDAFLSAWHNLRKLQNPASFLPWLRQITRNLARDHLRRQSLRRSGVDDVDAVIAQVADPAPCPAESLAEAQDLALAAEVIDALPEESREVLLLYYREGQSSRQVASLLGLQDAAVRKRLSRARQAIRAELLARVGDFARRTAPTAAFTAVVVGSLGIGAPGTAAAAVIAGSSAGAGKGFSAVLGASAGAVAFGILGGLAGIWFGIRKFLRAPLDRREFDELVVWGISLSTVVVAFTFGIIALSDVPGWIPHVLASLAFMAAMSLGCGTWLPRILKRRQERDMALDPVGTAQRLRRERLWSWIGAIVGIGTASAGLLYGLIASGRLG